MSGPSWLEVLYSLDFETTGVDPESDRVVTATLLRIEPGGSTKPIIWEWLIDPGVEIPEGAAKVHGITTERARAEGRPAAEAIPDLIKVLNEHMTGEHPLVVYNAPFDLTMGDREARRYGVELNRPVGIIDPFVIDKHVDKYRRGSRKLLDTCAHHGITLSEEDAHTSAGDTLAAARLAWKLAHHPQLRNLSLTEVHEKQWGWAKTQGLGFADYLEKKGRAEEARRVRLGASHWPMRPLATVVPDELPREREQAEIPF